MDIEHFRQYCLSKEQTTEETPFGPDTLVFKVAGKMFALVDIEQFHSTNLKCEPEIAQELRANYMAVEPGYHMNKKHWNTVAFNQDMSDVEILKWVDHSYELVVASLPKKVQASFQFLK